MATIIQARPRRENETQSEYINNLKNEGVLTDDILRDALVRVDDNGEIISETLAEKKENIKNLADRKNKRVNIFVTENFYDDIQKLQILYPNLSLSEIVVTLSDEYFNYLKQTDFWSKLIQLKSLRSEREEQFENFIKQKKESQQ